MSSSVRRRISAEDQFDDVVADEEQGRGAGDEREADDGDRGAGEHLGDLAPPPAPKEDHAEDGEEDRGDVLGEERDDALGVDAGRLGGGERTLLERREGVRGELGGDHRLTSPCPVGGCRAPCSGEASRRRPYRATSSSPRRVNRSGAAMLVCSL